MLFSEAGDTKVELFFTLVAISTDSPCLVSCNTTALIDWKFFVASPASLPFLASFITFSQQMCNWLAGNDSSCSAWSNIVIRNAGRRENQRVTKLPYMHRNSCKIFIIEYVRIHNTNSRYFSNAIFLYHFRLRRSEVWYELIWSETSTPFLALLYARTQSRFKISSPFRLDFPDGTEVALC